MFSTALITPAVVNLFDDDQDIAFFLDLNEEEENQGKKGEKGKEAAKDLEVKNYSTEQLSTLLLNRIQKKKNVSFQSKNYTSEYPKNTTPPPEFLS
jgi:hypothetical protein